MAGLQRVPAPSSPFHRGSAVLGGVLVVIIAALAIDPWGSTPAEPRPTPYRAGASPIPARVAAIAPTHAYRPEAFGSTAPAGAWELRTTNRVTAVPSLGVVEQGIIASGPVVDLGPADAVGALVINAPSGARLDEIRLWRFGAGRPERLDLKRLPPPWAVDHAWAVGLRVPGAAGARVGRWREGLYRLDLLVEPPERIRMVMLSVGPAEGDDVGGDGAAPAVSDRGTEGTDRFTDKVLRRLPEAANLWTFGSILTGWARPSAAGDCRVAEIWQARDPDAGCWPVPIGPASALGVNLTRGERVAAIALAAVDPLPGPMALRSDVGVGGQPGLAVLLTPAGGLADGVYRMSVELAGGGRRHWYVEVGPEGRQVALINAFVTGVQR
jgi:hypothetical protein